MTEKSSFKGDSKQIFNKFEDKEFIKLVFEVDDSLVDYGNK